MATTESTFHSATGRPRLGAESDHTGGGDILNRAAALRDRAGSLKDEVDGSHHKARLQHLDELTGMIARQDPHEVLAELSTDLGLSWTTLARMIGVTPTAIRKWRKGDSISSDNRRKISRARGFLELLTRNANPLEDVGSWLEIKVSGDSTLTAVDLFAGERMDLVLDLASARISPHEALEAFDPDWRSHHAADQAFKVVRASDGLPAIVETNSEQ